MLKIGIKYCGGCNSRYDRVKAVETIKCRYANFNFQTALPNSIYDIVLVICGCHTVCADHHTLQARIKKFLLYQERDYMELYQFMDSLTTEKEKVKPL